MTEYGLWKWRNRGNNHNIKFVLHVEFDSDICDFHRSVWMLLACPLGLLQFCSCKTTCSTKTTDKRPGCPCKIRKQFCSAECKCGKGNKICKIKDKILWIGWSRLFRIVKTLRSLPCDLFTSSEVCFCSFYVIFFCNYLSLLLLLFSLIFKLKSLGKLGVSSWVSDSKQSKRHAEVACNCLYVHKYGLLFWWLLASNPKQ